MDFDLVLKIVTILAGLAQLVLFACKDFPAFFKKPLSVHDCALLPATL